MTVEHLGCGQPSAYCHCQRPYCGLKLSKHAIDRYRQRGRPLSFKRGKAELEKLMEHAVWQNRAPEWAHGIRKYDGCLVIADLVLVVQNNTIVTCICKGTIHPRQRLARQVEKKARKARNARRRGL